MKTPEKYKMIDDIPSRLSTLSKIDLGALLSLSHTFIDMDTEIIFDEDEINIINELQKEMEMKIDHNNDNQQKQSSMILTSPFSLSPVPKLNSRD